jgi:hypothetical protein
MKGIFKKFLKPVSMTYDYFTGDDYIATIMEGNELKIEFTKNVTISKGTILLLELEVAPLKLVPGQIIPKLEN